MTTHLVVEAICDGVWLNTTAAHCKQHFDGQNWLMIKSAQLHQHSVAHLKLIPPTVSLHWQ